MSTEHYQVTNGCACKRRQIEEAHPRPVPSRAATVGALVLGAVAVAEAAGFLAVLNGSRPIEGLFYAGGSFATALTLFIAIAHFSRS